MTTITLTNDRRALCVRAAYRHRDIMLNLPQHLRRGVRDNTGFWWRVPLTGYDVVAFALPDASVDYDVLVALDNVDTRREAAKYYDGQRVQNVAIQMQGGNILITPMPTDDPDKTLQFSEFAKRHAKNWQLAERKRGRR